tara:strand:+ start:1839 stop:3269 length:1431 start_codon:yes stop_codon:yes gene_type:complete
MNKLLNIFYILVIFFLATILSAQDPFLMVKPYAAPEFEQYAIRHHTDHSYPTQTPNGINTRFDGNIFYNNIVAFNCTPGISCYDGHAGNDYHMPLGIPILAAADGYVVWSAFSPGADPCPGGIEPNGLTGTIIIYHYNDYFTCYLHLNPPLNVAVGETVAAGDTIGFNGMTGCASSPHLHFEVRKENQNFDQDLPWVIDPYGWWGDYEDPIIDLRGFTSVWLWKSDLIIDDGDTGFQRFYGPNWSYTNSGYNDDCWIIPASSDSVNSAHYAVWVPEIPDSGEYNIDVYTPNIADAATHALYEIYIKDESGSNTKTTVIHNQTNNPDSFTTITTINIPAGSNCAVILRDVVDSASVGSYVVFDALRFVNTANVKITDKQSPQVFPTDIILHQAYPNPFNTSTTLIYELSVNSVVKIEIFNILGSRVKTVLNEKQSAGYKMIVWDGTNDRNKTVPSGIYYYVVSANGFSKVNKMVLLK